MRFLPVCVVGSAELAEDDPVVPVACWVLPAIDVSISALAT